MSVVHRTLIVPASLTPLARALAAGLSPGGVGMFTTALDGATPNEAYISTGWIDEDIASLLTDANALHAACVAAGANVTLAQCQALVSQSDVSDDHPLVAMQRLGYTLHTDE